MANRSKPFRGCFMLSVAALAAYTGPAVRAGETLVPCKLLPDGTAEVRVPLPKIVRSAWRSGCRGASLTKNGRPCRTLAAYGLLALSDSNRAIDRLRAATTAVRVDGDRLVLTTVPLRA